jgi:hypothetical protein
MSNDLFPTLPGIRAEREQDIEFDNIVQRAESGRRYALGKRLYPVYRWKLTYNFLRQRSGHTEMTDLSGFFLRRRGNLDSFLFRDREWNTVSTPQVFGIGNGVQDTFRLVYTRGGFVDRVGYCSDPTVSVGGSITTAFTVNDNAEVTFDDPPADDAELAWAGEYLYRVAFVKPNLSLTQFLKDLYSTGVEIETVNR